MFTYLRTIRLKETDATGVLYCSELVSLGLEAFEAFLQAQGFVLSEMLAKKHFLMPVVHVEADFLAPLRVGDEVTIELALSHLGTKSFHLTTNIFKMKAKVGTTTIVHVPISKESGASILLPAELIELLQRL